MFVVKDLKGGIGEVKVVDGPIDFSPFYFPCPLDKIFEVAFGRCKVDRLSSWASSKDFAAVLAAKFS